VWAGGRTLVCYLLPVFINKCRQQLLLLQSQQKFIGVFFLFVVLPHKKRDVILTTECLIAFKNTGSSFQACWAPSIAIEVCSCCRCPTALWVPQSRDPRTTLGNISDVRLATRKSTGAVVFYTLTQIGPSPLKGTYIECVHKLCQGITNAIGLSKDV